MNYRYHPPVNAPEGYVRTILCVEAMSPGDSLPVLPQGTAALVCLFEKETPHKKAGVSLFLFTRSIDSEALRIYDEFSLIACFFHPFVALPLFGIPAQGSAGHPHELAAWNTKIATELDKVLRLAPGFPERMDLLGAFLHKRLRKNQTACEMIRLATDRMIAEPVKDILPLLLIELQTGERTLQRVFKKYVGCTPGQFRRLSQFYAAFHQLRSREFGSLSELAYDQGYADQSHFIRSFREFTRRNPGDYVRSGLSDTAK